MATATRTASTSLINELDDELLGSVPSPFPIFQVQRPAERGGIIRQEDARPSIAVQGPLAKTVNPHSLQPGAYHRLT